MKTTTGIAIYFATLFCLVSPALAETAARQDDSNFLVWAFLGVCALIIFLQMVPVISMTIGLIKAMTSSKKVEVELKPAPSKFR